MSGVSVSSAIILQQIRQLQECAAYFEQTKKTVMQQYQQCGSEWNDAQYRALGAIVQDVVKSLRRLEADMLVGKDCLTELLQYVQEYENSNITGAAGGSAGSGGQETAVCPDSNDAGMPPVDKTDNENRSGSALYGNSEFVPLLQTFQKKETIDINGRQVTVFDHPFSDKNRHVYNQGSAFPEDDNGDGITGTCGLCSVASIINKAGGNATERSIVEHAVQNGLCYNNADAEPEHRGGTDVSQRIQLLQNAGIDASPVVGNQSLEQISEYVEQGRGVIISVTASLYKPEWYGAYSEENRGGHAIVLESPLRDETGTIVEYVVSDSNGSTSAEASVIVSAQQLEQAFAERGGMAIVTNEVIW